MGAYCVVCDAPVKGDRCPTCGRPPTEVEEQGRSPEGSPGWWRSVPRWVWLVVGAVAVVVLVLLLQSTIGVT